LVGAAFFVYQTIVTSQEIAMVDDSRSARVFARLTGSIEDQKPDEALGWVTRQYENLVSTCDAPT
jgi:membrane protein required for colicin V production